MSEHQVRDRIFKKYINHEQNYLGHTVSSAKMLNMWALHLLCHDWPWNSKRNWGKFHLTGIALCLPSFPFPYWSGCFAERSCLGSAQVLPCLLLAWRFSQPLSGQLPAENSSCAHSFVLAHCCSAGAQQRSQGGWTCVWCYVVGVVSKECGSQSHCSLLREEFTF